MQNAHKLMTRCPPCHAKVTNDINSWVPASTYCEPDQTNKISKLAKLSRDTGFLFIHSLSVRVGWWSLTQLNTFLSDQPGTMVLNVTQGS